MATGLINWGNPSQSTAPRGSTGAGFSGSRINWGGVYANDVAAQKVKAAALQQEQNQLKIRMAQQTAKATNILSGSFLPKIPGTGADNINDVKTLQQALHNNQISVGDFTKRFPELQYGGPIKKSTFLQNLGGALKDTGEGVAKSIAEPVAQAANMVYETPVGRVLAPGSKSSSQLVEDVANKTKNPAAAAAVRAKGYQDILNQAGIGINDSKSQIGRHAASDLTQTALLGTGAPAENIAAKGIGAIIKGRAAPVLTKAAKTVAGGGAVGAAFNTVAAAGEPNAKPKDLPKAAGQGFVAGAGLSLLGTAAGAGAKKVVGAATPKAEAPAVETTATPAPKPKATPVETQASAPTEFNNKNVEMVPTDELSKYMQHDRTTSPLMSQEKYTALKADIQKNGIKEPLGLNYGAQDKIATLGEGNHRLAIAKELGIKELPVEVTGTSYRKADLVADKKGFATVKGREPDEHGYVPSNQKPSDIGVKTTSLKAPSELPESTKPKTTMNEAGGVKPGAVADSAAGSVKDFIGKTRQSGQATKTAGDLGDRMYALKKNYEADQAALTKMLKGTENFAPKDLEAAYHYAEDKTHPVTDAQKGIYEQYVKPIQDARNESMSKIKENAPANEDYMHRIAKDKGHGLERFLTGNTKLPKEGGILRKTTDSMKTRTMKAIVDDKGNRTVVSIKTPKDMLGKAKPGGKRVTALVKGKARELGPLKRPHLAKVTEYYDEHVMSGLNSLAKDLGIKHERVVKSRLLGKNAGVSVKGEPRIQTRAASPERTLLHEIGHQLDEKYNLQKEFNVRNSKEARALADLRHEGADTTPSFKSYVRKGEEKVAVMFEAYLHAPERFKEVAPETFAKFESFLKSHDETKPITELKPSLVLGKGEVGPEATPGSFVDKSGKVYKVTDATTKEIEANTDIRYYKHPIVSSALDYLSVRNAERANQFLEDWKAQPDFKNIAIKEGEGRVPNNWRGTNLPQFRGYYFEPKVAEVLDDFGGRLNSGDPLEILDGINRFLRNSIFFNPLIHVPNVTAAWATSRGLSGFVLPTSAIRLARTGVKAINEVAHQGPLYTKLLREGAPFMHFDQEKFASQITKMMDNELKDPSVAKRVAHALGYANPAKMLKAWYHLSHTVTWYSNDILTMQRILEERAKGKTDAQAIKEVGKFLPNYRAPSRLLGSRRAKQFFFHPTVSMFMPYHYGILKSYANEVRDLVGKNATAKERASAVDKLLIGGLIAFVGYPAADKAVQAITGNQNATVRRAGPYTIPNAIANAAKGKDTALHATEKAITPSVALKSAEELYTNKDYFGNQIIDWSKATKDPKEFLKEWGNFASNQVAPVAQGQKLASGKQSAGKFFLGLLGVSQPKGHLENQVNDLLSKQFGGKGMTIDQQKQATQKALARKQITDGKGDSLAKELVKQGTISKLDEFKADAKKAPLQRSFDSLSTENKYTVLKSATPAERKQLGDLHQIAVDAANTARSKTAKPQTVQAAKDLINLLHGDQGSLLHEYKQQQKVKRQQAKHH